MTKWELEEHDYGIEVSELELATMILIARRENGDSATVARMSGELGVSRPTLTRTLRLLVEKGLVMTRGRYRTDDGQLASDRALTSLGRTMMHDALHQLYVEALPRQVFAALSADVRSEAQGPA